MCVALQVNWSVLWRTWLERDVREVVVLPLIVLIILVPIGLFTGCSHTHTATHTHLYTLAHPLVLTH